MKNNFPSIVADKKLFAALFEIEEEDTWVPCDGYGMEETLQMFPGCDQGMPAWVQEEFTESTGGNQVYVMDNCLCVEGAYGDGGLASWDGQTWSNRS